MLLPPKQISFEERDRTDLHALRLIVADLAYIAGMLARGSPIPGEYIDTLDRHSETLTDMIGDDDLADETSE